MTSKYNSGAVDGNRTHFVQRGEPGYAWENAISTLLALPYLRGAWPMSSVSDEEVWRASDVSGQNNHLSDGGIGASAPEFARGTPLNHYVKLDGSSWLSMTNYVIDPPWYESVSGGLIAYDPYEAADLATSKVNLITPGTYDAAQWGVVAQPTHIVGSGWDFVATSAQVLDTTYIPATFDDNWCLAVWYDCDLQVSERPLLSAGHNGGTYFDIWAASFPSAGRLYGMNNQFTNVLPLDSDAWMALNGLDCYYNGAIEAVLPALGALAATGFSIKVGCNHTVLGVGKWFFDGRIKRVFIANRKLSAAEMATLYAAMTTSPAPAPPVGGISYVTVNAEVAIPGSRRIVAGDSIVLTDAGAGSTLTADLDTPGTLAVTSANNAAAPHSHAITTSANPGVARVILATDANGYLQLVRLGLAIAPSYPLHVSGTSHLDGAVVVNESGADADFRVEGNADTALITTDAATDRVGIGWLVPDGKLHINGTSDELQLVIDSVNGQTAHIQEWRDHAHNILSWVDKDGNFVVDRDNYGAFYGAGQNMEIYYDGSNGNIDTDLVAASDLVIDCGTAKTVVLEEVVWDDLRIVPGSFDRPGIEDPSIVAYDVNGGGISTYLWQFQKNAIASFSAQLPHTYKQGTDIYCHVHWTPGPNGAAENGNTVGWKIDYSWANINGNFPSMATLDLSDACNGIDDEHNMTPDVSISGLTKTVSSMLICNIKRTDTGADDTWTGTTSGELPMLLEIDFHFQIDTMGSRQRTAK